MLTVGALTYDPSARRLYKYGRAIKLGPAPLRLLLLLMEQPDRAHRVDDLIATISGEQVLPDTRARAVIRQQVRRIRLVIEDATGPWLIGERQWGYGLWVDPPVVRAEELMRPAACAL